MSHELRTPLTTILGFSEALQMQVYGELNPKQSESVGNIEKSGRNLLALINDILDLSRASAGMIVVEPEVVSVRELCRACLRLVRPASQEKQIEVEISIEEGVDEIQVDQQRMKQILVNLLNNAVKFSTRGSQVGLDVCGDAHNRRILFCVWDNGIGISPDDLSRLFLPFTQLDSALSRRYGGTGLGLSLVLKLVELLGGGVSVSSTPGEGSRFTVTLPWDSRLSPQENNPAPEILPAAHFTHRPSAPLVLIVEDNLLYLDLLSDILAHHGCRVIQAVNGEEGISRARENHPDLILMDIQMPVMDGYQAASSIRANPELARIPIIALTALAMNGDREKCVRAGMNDYLSKPVNTADLFRAMYALLDH